MCGSRSVEREARDQDDAVRLVRQEMLLLNSFVCKALREHGMTRRSIRPIHGRATLEPIFAEIWGAF